jgi:hypothetical protein
MHALSLREVALFRTPQPRRIASFWARKAFPFKGHNWLRDGLVHWGQFSARSFKSFPYSAKQNCRKVAAGFRLKILRNQEG